MGCRHRGDLGVVVGRRNLYNIRPHDPHAAKRTNNREEFPAGQSARFRSSRTGRMSGIEHVDVHRHINGTITETGEHPLDNRREASGLELVRRNHGESEAGIVCEVMLAVQRTADADVQARFEVDESLFGRAPERGAVSDRRAEVGVPGVEVRIEVQHRHRTGLLGDRPKQRQSDGVIAADREQAGVASTQMSGCFLDLFDGLCDVEGVCRYVARIGNLLGRKGSTSCTGL